MNTKTSRTKSAILNMVFNFVYQVVNTVVNVIIPPLIIGKYGSVINGLISTVKQILGYVQLVGAGISESTVVSLYKPLAERNTSKISAIYNACSNAFFKMGIVFNGLSVAVAFIYPAFVQEELDYFFLVALILVLSIAGASEFYVIGKCRALLTADQKIYIVNIAQICGAVANLLVTIILIHMDVSVVIIQAGASVVYAMRILIVYSYVKKHYVFLDKKEEPDFRAIDKRKAATVHQLSGLITFGSQTVFVSVFCGLAEASVYSVYNLVFTGINTILSTISSALLATFGSIAANDGKEKLKKVFGIYESFYYLLVFVLYSVTYVMFLSFVSLYTAGATDAVYLRPDFAILFCVMGIVNCLRTPGATLINAVGHYDETKNRALIEMMICFSLECILVYNFKAAGVLIATILAYLYRTIDVLFYTNRHILNQSAKCTVKKVLLNIFIYGSVVFVGSNVYIEASGYLFWIGKAIMVFVAMVMLYFAMNYLVSKKEYKEIYRNFMKERIK